MNEKSTFQENKWLISFLIILGILGSIAMIYVLFIDVEPQKFTEKLKFASWQDEAIYYAQGGKSPNNNTRTCIVYINKTVLPKIVEFYCNKPLGNIYASKNNMDLVSLAMESLFESGQLNMTEGYNFRATYPANSFWDDGAVPFDDQPKEKIGPEMETT